MGSMPQKYIELAKHIADKLEDWADPKDETGLRYEYVGYSKPISIAVEGLDELLQWLHHNQPEHGAVIQLQYDTLMSNAKLDDHLLETLYEDAEVLSEGSAEDLALALRSIVDMLEGVIVKEPEVIKSTGQLEKHSTPGHRTTGFKTEDEGLFLKVASDIGKSSDKYRAAGKWLDRYYDYDKSYCEKRKTGLVNRISKLECECESSNSSSFSWDEITFSDADLASLRTLKNEIVQKPPANIALQLAYALEDLWSEYTEGGVLGGNDARALLVVTWAATNTEADKANLSLTKFANLPWKGEASNSEQGRQGLAPFLFFDFDELLFYEAGGRGQRTYELDLLLLHLVRSAWAKVEAEKAYQDSEPTKELPGLNDTEQNIIEALGKNKMNGEPLARKTGYPYNSNFKSTLSSLRKRGILGNKSPGYFLEPEYYGLLKKPD